jgi:hypothetical protein
LRQINSFLWKQQVRSGEQTTTGSGLGLALCKDFIERGHNGNIGCSSTPGEGSCFFFEITFPVHHEPIPSSPSLHDDSVEIPPMIVRQSNSIVAIEMTHVAASRARTRSKATIPDEDLPISELGSDLDAHVDVDVVVVDDSAMTRKLFAKLLETLGVQCAMFQDGAEVMCFHFRFRFRFRFLFSQLISVPPLFLAGTID